MSDTSNGDDKKPSDKKSYDEKVTVRKRVGDKFLNPVPDVPTLRGEIKGQTVWYTKPLAGNSESPKGSEITDKDGVVWVVEKVTIASTFHINYVVKKP